MIQLGKKGGIFQLVTDKQLKKIHTATLQVLEQVGVATDSPRILKLFADAGADVDRKEKRIKLSPKLVEEALGNAPEKIKMCGRSRQRDILLEDGRVYFGLGGTPVPYFRDAATGKIKRPVKDDVAKTTVLGDALPNISFVMLIASSYDTPLETQYFHDLEALLNNTEKPIICAMPGAEYAQKALQMAAIIAGGEDQLRERSPISLYSESTSPLFFSKFIENVIEFAQKGIPIVFGPGPILGATGPGTVAGTFVMANAEILAGIVLCQAINLGTPIIYSPNGTVMDMRTARVCYTASETVLNRVLGAQMAKHYKLPSFLGSGVDSKVCDAQAGAEAMMTCLMSALAGVNLIQGVGTMAGGSYGSMEMAVICNEIIGMIYRFLDGVTIDSETLAVDVIREIGPGGNFLSHIHTLNFFKKELYMPELFNRQAPEEWIKAGEKDAETVAREKIRGFLGKYSPNPLPYQLQEKLKEILKKTEEEFIKED